MIKNNFVFAINNQEKEREREREEKKENKIPKEIKSKI
jgi:hypothetical protein